MKTTVIDHPPHRAVVHWEGLTPSLLPRILGMTPEELLETVKRKADERKETTTND